MPVKSDAARPPSKVRLDRDTILAAALELAATPGVSTISFRELGAHLSVDPTAVYRHFRNKEDLMKALLDELALRGIAQIDVPVEDWRGRLRAISMSTLRQFELYPAIDLQDGRAVRLRRGDFAQSTVFSDDPVAQARAFAEGGASVLHVVDLDGAREGQPVHAAIVASIAAAFPGTVHLGGGLRSRAAIETAMATGVDRVVVGTAVVEDRSLLEWAIDRLGDALVVGLDARQGKLATHGWTQITDRDAVGVATELVTMGVRRLAYTDINRDGTLGGPNLAALRRLSEAAPPLKLIASGGVSSLDDLRRLRDLRLANLEGVIVGRALYEGRFTVGEGLEALAERSRA